VDIGHSVNCSFLHLTFHFQDFFRISHVQYWVIAWQWHNCDLNKLPYEHLFAKGPTCGCWLPLFNNISLMGKAAHHLGTIWYRREHIASHIRELRILLVCFLLFTPPVGNIWYLLGTAKLYAVG
jgi:hypothetical protein